MIALIDKRAIKIVELQEELEQAKNIIGKFVWPPDATLKQRQIFKVNAAHFAEVSIPRYKMDGENNERMRDE